jgi:hypothetical protein
VSWKALRELRSESRIAGGRQKCYDAGNRIPGGDTSFCHRAHTRDSAGAEVEWKGERWLLGRRWGIQRVAPASRFWLWLRLGGLLRLFASFIFVSHGCKDDTKRVGRKEGGRFFSLQRREIEPYLFAIQIPFRYYL